MEQNFFLILNVLDLLFLKEQVLVDPFHSIHLAHLGIGDEEHLTKAAFIDDFGDLEVGQVNLLTMEARLTNQTATLALVLLVLFLS